MHVNPDGSDFTGFQPQGPTVESSPPNQDTSGKKEKLKPRSILCIPYYDGRLSAYYDAEFIVGVRPDAGNVARFYVDFVSGLTVAARGDCMEFGNRWLAALRDNRRL